MTDVSRDPRLTKLLNGLTALGGTALLAILGWIGLNLTQMHDAILVLQTTFEYEAREIKDHDDQIKALWRWVGARPASKGTDQHDGPR